MRHIELPTSDHPVPTLVVDGRRVPLPEGVAVAAAPGARFRRQDRRVTVVSTGAEPMSYRGAVCRRALLGPGDSLLIGRAPIVVAWGSVSRRFPEAVVWHGMLGQEPRTLDMYARIAVAGASDAPLWLLGESGTGKELAAQAAHAAGARAKGPLVAVNCAAMPDTLAEAELFGVVRGAYTGADRTRPGAFAEADGGTLFLDEIGELPLAVQAKLLRVLERGEVRAVGAQRPVSVDVRVIAASWRDLAAAAEEGAFRFDLLQRLWVLQVCLPPLRARPDDVGPLLEAFLGAHGGADLWPADHVLRRMRLARWPGNVRELRNRAVRAAVTGHLSELLPDAPRRAPGMRALRRGAVSSQVALGRIHDALDRAGGNRSAAARDLGISRSTLYRWLETA